MARKKVVDVSKVSNISSVKFSNCRFELLKSKKAGRFILTLNISYTDRPQKSTKYIIPIHSIWVDEFSNNVIKCFCIIRSARNFELARLISEFGMIQYDENYQMVITYNNGIIRYGTKPDIRYELEDEDYVKSEAYSTKPELVLSLLDNIKANGIQTAGFNFANLNLIPDQLLLGFGFGMIEDYFRRSNPMWLANTGSILNPDEKRYFDGTSIRNQSVALVNIIKAIVEKGS
jgi:hypothetical protein